MRIILSDKKLDSAFFPEDCQVISVTLKTLNLYNGDKRVWAVAGSRAMAIQAVKMELPNLKLFQLTSAGFDGVPNEQFAAKGVAVANAGTVYSVPIAETVVFGMLLLAKKLHSNPNNRHFRLYRHYRTITELAGKQVLILGAGNIGTAVANRLQGFDVQIDGYDPFCPEKPQYRKMIRARADLLAVIGQYDYIVTTLPGNEQTAGFLNAELFHVMKRTAVVINVGRKSAFSEDDFYRALKTKSLGGAVLDQFELLPNPLTNRFRRLRNVVVLPGVAAVSQEVNERLCEHMSRNIAAALTGQEIRFIINGVN